MIPEPAVGTQGKQQNRKQCSFSSKREERPSTGKQKHWKCAVPLTGGDAGTILLSFFFCMLEEDVTAFYAL